MNIIFKQELSMNDFIKKAAGQMTEKSNKL